jgi:hypothetical protein
VIEHLQDFVCILLVEAERPHATDDIAFFSSLSHEDALLLEFLQILAGGLAVVLFGFLVFDEFDCEHHALAADVSNFAALLGRLLETILQNVADVSGIFMEFLFSEDLQDFQSKPTLHGTSSVSIKEHVVEGGHYFFAGDDCGHRVTICHGLGCNHNIGLDSLPLETPEIFADSAKTGLHLIGDHETAVLTSEFSHPLEISIW